MPRIQTYLTLLLLFFSLFGCKKSTDSKMVTVEGSWNLEKYLDHRTNEWKTYGDSIMYQKHLSPTFFVWFSFDTKNEKLLGLGGGPYSVEDGEYTENIAFFYPPIPNIIGESIPFSMQFEKGKWLHQGFFMHEKRDPETAEIISMDSVKIKEVWTRTDIPSNANLDLVNTWSMTSFREGLQEQYIEYPDFIRSIKLITPTHFVWVKYETQGTEVYAAGSGPYTFDDDNYSETIEMIFPENTGQIGKTINFEFRLNDNQWHHHGYVPKLVIDSVGIRKDSILIDEYWAPYTQIGKFY